MSKVLVTGGSYAAKQLACFCTENFPDLRTDQFWDQFKNDPGVTLSSGFWNDGPKKYEGKFHDDPVFNAFESFFSGGIPENNLDEKLKEISDSTAEAEPEAPVWKVGDQYSGLTRTVHGYWI